MVAKKEKIVVTCEVCGTTFEVHPYRARENARFCGATCYHLWRKGKTLSRTIPVSTDELVRQYDSGMTLSAIAEQYNVTLQAIAYHLKKAGAETRKPTGENLRAPDAVEKMRQANTGRPGYSFKQLPVQEICDAYKSGDSTTVLGRRYGVSGSTILKRLRKAGAKTRRQGFSRFRKCSDGHVVQSRWEQAVDEWLARHSIPHEVQPECPWAKWRARQLGDFRVGDVFIEVWGIEGNAKYDQRRLEKIAKYQEYGVRLIEIFPHHILDQDYSPLHCLLDSTPT